MGLIILMISRLISDAQSKAKPMTAATAQSDGLLMPKAQRSRVDDIGDASATAASITEISVIRGLLRGHASATKSSTPRRDYTDARRRKKHHQLRASRH